MEECLAIVLCLVCHNSDVVNQNTVYLLGLSLAIWDLDSSVPLNVLELLKQREWVLGFILEMIRQCHIVLDSLLLLLLRRDLCWLGL